MCAVLTVTLWSVLIVINPIPVPVSYIQHSGIFRHKATCLHRKGGTKN